MRKLPLLLVCALFFGFVGDDYVKVKLTDDITIFVPSDFHSLEQEEINRRLHSPRKPLAFYTDTHNEIDFSVNMSYSLWAEKDVEILRSFYRSTLLSLYDEVNFIKDEVVEVNGRKYAEFEFISTVRDDESAIIQKGDIKSYTLIRYTILKNNNTVLLNFTCPARRQQEWDNIAREIMDRAVIN